MATVPPAPTAFAPYQATDTELWVNVDSNGNGGSGVIDWQIRYSKNKDGDVETGAKYLYFDNVAHISFLERYTTYYFWARGRNAIGWGPYSNRVYGHTLPRKPNTPPAPIIDNYSASTISMYTGVYVGDIDIDDAPILEINLAGGRSSDVTTMNIYQSDGDTTITNLAPYVTYYFRARIRNEGGWSNWSGASSQRTDPVLPQPPHSDSLHTYTQYSIWINFSDPDDTGGAPILERQVGYGTSSSYPQSYTSQGNSVNVGGLQRYTVYYFWTRVRTEAGWSGWSNQLNGRTLAYPPAPTTPTSCNAQSQTEVYYTFNGNDNGGSSVLEWQVGYGTDPNFVQSTISSDGSSLIGNLKPGTTYYFWSRGRNVQGWGNWSARSQATTIAGARVRYAGTWHQAIPMVRQWNLWNPAQPYVRVNGVWKKTG